MDNKEFQLLMETYKNNIKEAKVSWNDNIIIKYHPKFDINKDRVYWSQEVSGKADHYYTKLIPNSISTFQDDDGKKYILLKKSGKRIHSDDFSAILNLAKNKKFNIYTFDNHNATISGKEVYLDGKSREIFNGSKGKWEK